MKYIVFLLALSAWAQTFPPSSSGNARAIHGKPICASVMTATDGQVLAWSTASSCWVASSAGAGVGDVTGAASLSTGGLIAIAGATAGSVATDSGLAFNTTTKAVGIFGPIIGGQNSTYQGKLQLRGLTSGVSTLSADADGSGMTLDGRLTVTELVAGTTGANLFTAITAPATPSAGIGAVYVDSTSKNLAVKDDAGVVKHGVQTKTAASNQVLRAIADDGTVTQSALAAADIPSTLTSGTAITNAALTTPSIGAATGTSLLATGIVSGTAPIAINTGSDPCPTGTHCTFGTTYKNGYVFNQQTAATRVYIDLPTAAAGLQWCIKNSVVGGTGAAVTGIITVKAQTGDYINNDGTIGSSGGVLSSAGAAGDGACFVASAANHWEAFIGKGTWAP